MLLCAKQSFFPRQLQPAITSEDQMTEEDWRFMKASDVKKQQRFPAEIEMTKALFTHKTKFKPGFILYFFIHNKSYFCDFFLEASENKDTSQDISNELNRIVLHIIARKIKTETHRLLELCKVRAIVK